MECVEGKLFVGGLKRETTEETLEQHFSRYGQVKDCQIMKDWSMGTGRSRGFGFVVFSDPAHAQQALHSRYPTIDGKMVEVKPAIPRYQRATPRDTHATINIYNTYTTGLDLGFGTGIPMYGFGPSSGTYLPLVYCDSEGNPYNGGFCHYYPSPFTPLPNYNYVAPSFYGVTMYTDNNYTSIGSNDRVNANYYTSRRSHVNGGVGDHVNVERPDHSANYYTGRGFHVNGRIGDHVNVEGAGVDDNTEIEVRPNGGVGDSRNEKRADHASPSPSSGVLDDFSGNEERANQSVDVCAVNKECADHDDPGPGNSSGDVSSRSNGNYDRPIGITPSVHMSYAEDLITKSNGSDTHKGAMDRCNSTPMILQK